jgi:hypothetical protein
LKSSAFIGSFWQRFGQARSVTLSPVLATDGEFGFATSGGAKDRVALGALDGCLGVREDLAHV